MELKEVVFHLRDYTGPTHRLLTTWADTPMVLMMEEDWERGPLVIIGAAHGPILREVLARVPGVRVMPPGDALR